MTANGYYAVHYYEIPSDIQEELTNGDEEILYALSRNGTYYTNRQRKKHYREWYLFTTKRIVYIQDDAKHERYSRKINNEDIDKYYTENNHIIFRVNTCTSRIPIDNDFSAEKILKVVSKYWRKE